MIEFKSILLFMGLFILIILVAFSFNNSFKLLEPQEKTEQWYLCKDTDSSNEATIKGTTEIFWLKEGRFNEEKTQLVKELPDVCTSNSTVKQYGCNSYDYPLVINSPETVNISDLEHNDPKASNWLRKQKAFIYSIEENCPKRMTCSDGICTPDKNAPKLSCANPFAVHGIRKYFWSCKWSRYSSSTTAKYPLGCWGICKNGIWEKPSWKEILFGIN